MIVGAGTVTSTDSLVLQLFRNRGSAAAPAGEDTSPLLAPLQSRPASRSTASDALARIQELVKGGASGASREQEAIARVKSWVASGNAADAAAGRDSAWLQQMARDGKLGDLHPLTREQEDTLSRAELRVYVEARHWQAYYDGQPKTLAQAQADYVAMKKETLPDTIRRMSAALASGDVPDELAGAWKPISRIWSRSFRLCGPAG